MAKKYLAFDLGASSGRAIIGGLENGKLVLQEIHRFPNNGERQQDGSLRWNLPVIVAELEKGLAAAKDFAPVSVGIDTWGVDYVLFDADKKPVELPYTYRDERTNNILPEVYSVIPREELFRHTGIQELTFNTAFQLFAHAKKDKALLERCTFLHIPDALGFLLGGSFDTEYTDASTGALLNAADGDWDWEVIERLGLPKRLFPKVVRPGSSGGTLSKIAAERTGLPQLPIVKIGSHDTASAVAAVPDGSGEEFAFMSCGTWALLGAEIPQPDTTCAAMAAGYTNEGGVNGTIRFLTNIMGCWLFQECRRSWQAEGKSFEFKDFNRMAEEVEPDKFHFEIAGDEFLAPGNMPQRIQEACRRYGAVPVTCGEILRAVYDSLAGAIAGKLRELEQLRQKQYPCLYIVGGGTQDRLLMRRIAEVTGKKVVAGPVEATAIGNILCQMMASGEVADLAAGRELVRRSCEVEVFQG